MLKKTISSIMLLILGMGIFIFGNYMSHKAIQGEEKISQAEENNQGRRRPIIGPIRKSLRSNAAETAKEKINEEEKKIDQYQVRANWFRGIGIAIFFIGIASLMFGFSPKKRN